MIPVDIRKRIVQDFENENEQSEVLQFIRHIYSEQWNIGTDQFARSIIVLLDKNISLLKQFEEIDDPRDIVLMAERKIGSPGHYFVDSF